MARYWTSAFPRTRRELRAWRARAARIPDPELRGDAERTLGSERLNADGASLFDAVAGAREPRLLPALVSFQLMWDLLDTLAERPARDPVDNGRRLHRLLPEALTPGAAFSDHLAAHTAHDDGGYLVDLARGCRGAFQALPGAGLATETAVRLAAGAEVQAHNHGPPGARDDGLRGWAARAHPGRDEPWFELAAAASSSLGVLALMAAAADGGCSGAEIEETSAAYVPVCALSTLLDSLVDEPDDRRTGEHSYVAHYASRAELTRALGAIAERAFDGVRELRHGERHAVIVAGMTAMYLSRPSAWTDAARPASEAVLDAGGGLTRRLLTVLRLRRRSLGATADAPAPPAAVSPRSGPADAAPSPPARPGRPAGRGGSRCR